MQNQNARKRIELEGPFDLPSPVHTCVANMFGPVRYRTETMYELLLGTLNQTFLDWKSAALQEAFESTILDKTTVNYDVVEDEGVCRMRPSWIY